MSASSSRPFIIFRKTSSVSACFFVLPEICRISGRLKDCFKSGGSKLIRKENNFKLLHLGGGRGKNDSLFEFKKGFSNDIIPFYIGKMIFDMKTYKSLRTMNSMSATSNNYFPAYRQGFDDKIV